MRNLYFLKKSYISIVPYVVILYVLIIGFFVFELVKGSEFFILSVVAMILFTVVSGVIIKYDRSMGLYINGADVWYKTVKSKKIDVDEIAGIKIIQAYGATTYKPFYPLKNRKGESLYSAIFLKSLSEEMFGYKKGDLWFYNDFKKHVICLTVYEKETIEYLRTLNPDIKIIA